MLFNSLPFLLIFLPLSFFIYFILNKKHLVQAGIFWLCLCSLFFYAYWRISALPLLLCSIIVNYVISYFILSTRVAAKKQLLITGIVFNILFLMYFKYLGFIITNITPLLTINHHTLQAALPLSVGLFATGSIVYKLGWYRRYRRLMIAISTLLAFSFILFYGIDSTWFNHIHADKISLPIGISFFTFTQIAFLVDTYRQPTPKYPFINYISFVSYFPHLLAGPIIHHADMMPQFTYLRKKIINYQHIYLGLTLLAIGLFKKVVLADTFAIWVNDGYTHIDHLNMLSAWVSMFSYTLQLYFDFSGYTDMAIGISYLFNISLPINFNSPYKSLSIREFWQRWHITLSQFLKNYLYIFIGGNRVSESKILRNFLIVFLIGGIWHGAGWTFIVWGLLHGIAMAVNKLWKKTHIVLPTLLAWLITFLFINFTWVFFRARSLNDAVHVLKACFDYHAITMVNPLIIAAILIGLVICLCFKNSYQLIHSNVLSWSITPWVMGGVCLLSIYILIIRNSSAFLYFQF